MLTKRLKDQDGSPSNPRTLLHEGDWLDVMDGDGIWNVARVLSVPSPEEVEITYDGWPDEFDEVVRLDSDRVAPYHTFTWAVKCWVKYLNWPLWPSLITIRTPGTNNGIRNLAAEDRLYVDFLDKPSFAERDRCWQKRRQVRTFEDRYETKRTGSTGREFERALGWVLQSDASTKMPKFALGTLPMEYKFSPTESVEAVRKSIGDNLWFQNFTKNRIHHQQTHVYDTIGDEEDATPSDNSVPPTLNKMWLNLSAMKSEPLMITDEKLVPPITIEPDTRAEVKEPFELEPTNSSEEDSESETKLGNSRPKRKRLHTKRRPSGLAKSKKVGHEEASSWTSPQAESAPKSVGGSVMTGDIRLSQLTERMKMAARRNIPRRKELLNLATRDVPPTNRFSGSDEKEENDTQRANSGGNLVSKASITPYERSKAAIERQIADAEKTLQALIEEKQRATKQASQREQVRLNGPSPSSTYSQNAIPSRSRLVSTHRSRSNPEPSLITQTIGDLHMASMQKSSAPHQVTTESPMGLRRLGRSLISPSNADSSGSGDSNSVSDGEILNGNSEEIEDTGNADAKEEAAVEICVDKTLLPLANVDGNGSNDDGGVREVRRRYCVMQADKKEAATAESTKKEKRYTQTEISVPRKFDEGSSSQIPARYTNPMLGIASPPRLLLFGSAARTGVVLTSPSTAVFNSSKGFSMESWFKRKQFGNYMGGG